MQNNELFDTFNFYEYTLANVLHSVLITGLMTGRHKRNNQEYKALHIKIPSNFKNKIFVA